MIEEKDNSKQDKNSGLNKTIAALHKDAIEKNEETYVDPQTGYKVFTAKYLLERGYCCNCGCRHCPY